MTPRATLPEGSRLREILDAFTGVSIALWGDFVLDEFLLGEVNRISREAPVLILDYVRSQYVPGGAANTAANVAALGARVIPLGVVGDDDPGQRLLDELARRGLDAGAIQAVSGQMTPVKTRVSGAGLHTTQQQIVRIDRGRPFVLDPTCRAAMAGRVEEILPDVSAVIIGDYGYGSVDPATVRRLAAGTPDHGRPVMVDSRWRLLEFEGVQAVTPNEPEVEATLGISLRGAGEPGLAQAGLELLRRLRCASVLITRGSQGMAVFSDDQPPAFIPGHGTDAVADVTGAGDTVMATYAVALAAGATPLEAAHLANIAGGLVVMKQGTATVTADELRRVVRGLETTS